MTDAGSGSAPDDPATGSWATESLPLSVRKELLQRELSKRGRGKGGTVGSAMQEAAVAQQQQQPQGSSSRHADAAGDVAAAPPD